MGLLIQRSEHKFPLSKTRMRYDEVTLHIIECPLSEGSCVDSIFAERQDIQIDCTRTISIRSYTANDGLYPFYQRQELDRG